MHYIFIKNFDYCYIIQKHMSETSIIVTAFFSLNKVYEITVFPIKNS